MRRCYDLRRVCTAVFLGWVLGAGSLTASGFYGKWKVVEKIDASACGEEDSEMKIDIRIYKGKQGKTFLSVLGDSYEATIKGNTLRCKIKYWHFGDITKKMEFKLAPSGKSFSGSATWTYASKLLDYSCKGTSTFSGKRKK